MYKRTLQMLQEQKQMWCNLPHRCRTIIKCCLCESLMISTGYSLIASSVYVYNVEMLIWIRMLYIDYMWRMSDDCN